MNFVDGNGRAKPVLFFTRGEPVAVVPRIGLQVGDDGAGFGTKLGTKCVRIRLEGKESSVWSSDFVFIDGAFAKIGKEKLPDAERAARTHRMDAAVPPVEIADDADATRGRRPDG